MSQLRKNFTYLMAVLISIMVGLIILAMTLASNTAAAQQPGPAGVLTPPVSLNALMVTLVDHSAHYIWDYGTMQTR